MSPVQLYTAELQKRLKKVEKERNIGGIKVGLDFEVWRMQTTLC